MGKVDAMSKELYKSNSVFADTINLLFFEGAEACDETDIVPLDTTEGYTIFAEQSTHNGKKELAFPNQKYRDSLRMLCGLNGVVEAHIIVGSELQSYIDYAMPVRSMTYDALNYSGQISEKVRYNTENKLYRNDSEFLSKVTADDKFTPVLTMVVYFGSRPWDGPLRLHEMLDLTGIPDELMVYIPDYKVPLLQPSDVTPDQLKKLKSPLKHILGMIKYSTDWQEMYRYMKDNEEELKRMDNLSAGLVNEICNIAIPDEELKKEEVNMCKAIMEMRQEAVSEGKIEGRLEGKIEGKVFAYIELGKSREWIMEHLGIDSDEYNKIYENL